MSKKRDYPSHSVKDNLFLDTGHNGIFLKNLDLVHRMLTVGLSFIKSIVISNMLKKKSKQLSYVLRHQISEDFLLGGWLLVSNILREVDIYMEELETIVAENDKGRYELSDDKSSIRALYGHSVPVDLNYKPSTPPDYLYHGTAESNYNSIIEKGVISKNRQFV